MWNSPITEQEFTLCAADGTVLAELPPTMRLDSVIGLPERKKPPTPQKSTKLESGDKTTTVITTKGAGGDDVSGTSLKRVTEIVDEVEDYYTWERAPFSAEWFPLGDGLPKEKPKETAGRTVITEVDGKRVTERTTKSQTVVNPTEAEQVLAGRTPSTTTVTETLTTTELTNTAPEVTVTTSSTGTVREEVSRQATSLNGRPAIATTTHTVTTPNTQGGRYVVSPAFWGDSPTQSQSTNSIQTAYETAYQLSISHDSEFWVLELKDGDYDVVEKFEAPESPRITLAGQWEYETADDALAHAAEIEKALNVATHLCYRGRTIAQLSDATNLFALKTADVLRDVSYTLTLYTTEYFTAQEFMRRQLQ